jgi:ribosomal protein S18 acetylase RimI-like enzyme
LAVYAGKLTANARRFEAWDRGELVGLVAAYCNAGDRQRAFVTNVSVLPQAQGKGIASQLVRRCISATRRAGFGRLELEVDTANARAVALYARHGFCRISEGGGTAAMAIELDGTKR